MNLSKWITSTSWSSVHKGEFPVISQNIIYMYIPKIHGHTVFCLLVDIIYLFFYLKILDSIL